MEMTITLEYKNDLWQVLKTQHVKPGKGNAFVRTKIKSLTTGKVLDHTFSAGHKVDDVRVVNMKGKTRRTRTGMGQRSDWKKAYVRLAEGQDIDFSVAE